MCIWPAGKHTVIEVEAVGTDGDARVGAFIEVETSPACGALVATTTNAGVARGEALLATLLIITEKATGALRHAHPGEKSTSQKAKVTDSLFH